MSVRLKKILLFLVVISFLVFLFFFLRPTHSPNKTQTIAAWNNLQIEYSRRENLSLILVNYLNKYSLNKTSKEKALISNISSFVTEIKNLRKDCQSYEDLKKEPCQKLENLEKKLDFALGDFKKAADSNSALNKDSNFLIFRAQLTSLEKRIDDNRVLLKSNN